MVTTKPPFLSVIIPSYNRFTYAIEAIDSVLAQDYSGIQITSRDVEIIVVFDGGNSSFAAIIKNLYKDYPVQFHSKQNGGVSSALNYGICASTGKFINWLSDDDLMEKNHIKLFYQRYYETHFTLRFKPNIIYGGWKIVDSHGDMTGDITCHSELIQNPNLREECLFPLITSGIHGCSLWIEKVLFERYGFFDESQRTTQDYSLWFRLFQKANLLSADQSTTILSRHHSSQDSVTISSVCTKESNLLWTAFAEAFKSTPQKNDFTCFDYLETLRNHLIRSNLATAYQNLLSISRENHPLIILKLISSEFHLEEHTGLVRRFLENDCFLDLIYYVIVLIDESTGNAAPIFSNHELCNTSNQFIHDLFRSFFYQLFSGEYFREIEIGFEIFDDNDQLYKIIHDSLYRL